MAHELTIDKDKHAEMMYVGVTPWHGLGTRLENVATSEEAIVAARMNWQVEKKQIFHFINGVPQEVTTHKAVVRMDTNNVLGVVSNQYKPLQNNEAFDFFDGIVGAKEAIFHTCGSLNDGQRIWILAKLPDSMMIAKNDEVEKFLLLSNSHNGKTAVNMMFTPIRVVCANTLAAAMGGREKQKEAIESGTMVQVMHKGNISQKLDRATEILGIIRSKFQMIEDRYVLMAGKQIGRDMLDIYFHKIFPEPTIEKYKDEEAYEKAMDKHRERKVKIVNLFEYGKGNDAPGVRGTLWAAYNGVVEFIDYKGIEKNQDDKHRLKNLNNIWFGDGMRVKSLAMKAANEILVGSV